ncbi:hypothetical protein HMPREF0201_02796 [Cedecea davisae DSM 4568]|uniref:Uncharacterized protein n=1 Tax=Cedecea davisae DSM 4568 TaxID=566551 RepID=S3IV29_9ENTR|nr:hypothetical protein HMPREF0201_02796 [Cedecea davisae DSM 4568]
MNLVFFVVLCFYCFRLGGGIDCILSNGGKRCRSISSAVFL